MWIHVARHRTIVGLYGPTNCFEPILIPSNGMSCPFSVIGCCAARSHTKPGGTAGSARTPLAAYLGVEWLWSKLSTAPGGSWRTQIMLQNMTKFPSHSAAKKLQDFSEHRQAIRLLCVKVVWDQRLHRQCSCAVGESNCVQLGKASHFERMANAFSPMRSPIFFASALSSSEMSSQQALGVSSLQ